MDCAAIDGRIASHHGLLAKCPGMSLDVGGSIRPRSVGRRRPGDFAVVAAIDSVAAVVPSVIPAVSGLGYDEAQSVVQEIRRVNSQPSAPSGIAEAQRVVGNVTLSKVRHGLRIGREGIAMCAPMTLGATASGAWPKIRPWSAPRVMPGPGPRRVACLS